MAWIESHSRVRAHPKTAELRSATGWTLTTAVGKLHLLWWWCMEFAEDGDLSKHAPSRLAVGLDMTPSKGKWLVAALTNSGWVDKNPYLRVHDWWDYAGPFLRSKYKRNPERWARVKDLYVTGTGEVTSPPRNRDAEVTSPGRTGDVTPEPNQTKPNQLQRPHGSPSAVDFKALSDSKGLDPLLVRMPPWSKEFGGVPVADIPADTCHWFLTKWDRRGGISAKVRAALEARVAVKAAEAIPVEAK